MTNHCAVISLKNENQISYSGNVLFSTLVLRVLWVYNYRCISYSMYWQFYRPTRVLSEQVKLMCNISSGLMSVTKGVVIYEIIAINIIHYLREMTLNMMRKILRCQYTASHFLQFYSFYFHVHNYSYNFSY